MKILYTAAVVIWILALVRLSSRRDIEIHTKISWLVAVLVLNVFGALAYFFFGPPVHATSPEDEIDPQAKPLNPEHKRWNVLTGENALADGQGLNPATPPGTDAEAEESNDTEDEQHTG